MAARRWDSFREAKDDAGTGLGRKNLALGKAGAGGLAEAM
jgi:hypothetical protein